jgi:hypothetical protein
MVESLLISPQRLDVSAAVKNGKGLPMFEHHSMGVDPRRGRHEREIVVNAAPVCWE